MSTSGWTEDKGASGVITHSCHSNAGTYFAYHQIDRVQISPRFDITWNPFPNASVSQTGVGSRSGFTLSFFLEDDSTMCKVLGLKGDCV